MSACYLALHIYQCAQLQQLLNLGLEQSHLYRPKKRKPQNYNRFRNIPFLEKTKEKKTMSDMLKSHLFVSPYIVRGWQ